jgi:hypothetical protein
MMIFLFIPVIVPYYSYRIESNRDRALLSVTQPPSESVAPFDPSSCNLSDSDSVVLPARDVPEYLDRALKVLGLHIEARTSFIT